MRSVGGVWWVEDGAFAPPPMPLTKTLSSAPSSASCMPALARGRDDWTGVRSRGAAEMGAASLQAGKVGIAAAQRWRRASSILPALILASSFGARRVETSGGCSLGSGRRWAGGCGALPAWGERGGQRGGVKEGGEKIGRGGRHAMASLRMLGGDRQNDGEGAAGEALATQGGGGEQTVGDAIVGKAGEHREGDVDYAAVDYMPKPMRWVKQASSMLGVAREPQPILGGVLKKQVERISSSLWSNGLRSTGLQLGASLMSAAALALSVLMQVNSFALDIVQPTVKSFMLDALRQGHVACSISLLLSLAHIVWTLGYLRTSGRVRSIAQKSATEGLGPLLGKFRQVSKALDVGFVIGLAGAVAAFIATEQLLGVMVSKMLIAKGIGVQFWLTNPPARLQALDIFSMQSAVLCLGSHIAGLYFTHSIRSSVPARS